MTDLIGEFFDRMVAEPHPALHNLQAMLRIDVLDRTTVTHWYLAIDRGKVVVTNRDGDANAVIIVDRELFERMVTGSANAFTSALRGQLRFEGDAGLLVVLQKVLPGPAHQQRRPKASTREGA